MLETFKVIFATTTEVFKTIFGVCVSIVRESLYTKFHYQMLSEKC